MPRDQTSQTDSLLQCAPVSIRHETRGCVLPESGIEPWPKVCYGYASESNGCVQLFGVTVHGKEYSKAVKLATACGLLRNKEILAHLHTVPAPPPLARTGHSKQKRTTYRVKYPVK